MENGGGTADCAGPARPTDDPRSDGPQPGGVSTQPRLQVRSDGPAPAARSRGGLLRAGPEAPPQHGGERSISC